MTLALSPLRTIAVARPLRDTRPTLALVQARRAWHLAGTVLQALKAGDADSLAAAYAPDARMSSPILGLLEGAEIDEALRAHLRRNRGWRFDFRIDNAAPGAAEASWRASYLFCATNRQIEIEGRSRFLFGAHGVELQEDRFNLRDWSRQALGFSGVVLSYLPGWRLFVQDEFKRALGVGPYAE